MNTFEFCYSFGLYQHIIDFQAKLTRYISYLPGDCCRLTELVTVIIYLTHCYPEVVLCILSYIFILMNQVRSTFKCIIRFEPTERLMKV